ncbi:MAG: tetratricopeptide repeat protein [Acidobacteriota bacterium]
MRRSWFGALALVAVAVGSLLAVNAVLREREYQQLILRGDTALTSDQAFVAIEAYSGAIALKGNSMIAYLKRGEAYRRRAEMGAAIRDLRTATRLDPAAIRPAELLGDLSYGLERFSRAAESYQACVRLDDRSPRILYKLALALYRSGDAAKAIDPLRKAATIDDRFAEAHYLLGLCLRSQGQPGEALRSQEQAIKSSPGLVAPREELAQLYTGAGRSREAIEQLEAIAALEADRPERQASVGLAYARLGKTEEAIGVLRQAAERFPGNATIYATLGRVWLNAAEPRRDRVSLRKAIEAVEPLARGPSVSGEALAVYGRALLVSGETNAGITALQQAADILPVKPETLMWLANGAEQMGRLPMARSALERWAVLASESDAARPAVYERIGVLSQRLGDALGAVQAWRHLTDSSASVDVLARLATAEVGVGQVAAARQTVARGLKRNPHHPVLLALQQRLQ